MGSIERYGKKKNLKSIRLIIPDGSRKRLYLGKVTIKQAKEINQHCENIIATGKHGVPLPDSSVVWLDGVTDEFREKLETLDLINRRGDCTIGGFTREYNESRSDLKPGTLLQLYYARNFLIECFDESKNLRDFNRGDADQLRLFLINKGLSEATLRRHCGRARQYFNAARKRNLISVNPFDEISVTVSSNRDRMHYVTIEEAMKTLEAMPNAEWRALFALCRFGGLRCVSEVMLVRWVDIHWGTSRMTVWSPKTEHHPNGGSRIIPLFPELRQYLSERFEQAGEGEEYVIHNLRTSSAYLRKMIRKFIESAGLKPWEKLFQNMRSTRQTELSDVHPAKAVCQWMGNSLGVANEHYLQVTDAHFEKAIECRVVPGGQKEGQSGTESSRIDQNRGKSLSSENRPQEPFESTIQEDTTQYGDLHNVDSNSLFHSNCPTRI